MSLCRECPKYKLENSLIHLELCITGTSANQVHGNDEACEVGKKLIQGIEDTHGIDDAKAIIDFIKSPPMGKVTGRRVIIEITILGEPVSCLRARTVRNKWTGKIHSYTPEKTANYKEYLKGVINDSYKGIVEQGAVLMGLKVFRGIPKSFSQKKAALAEQGIIRPITKPDIDNYIKGICDSMRSIVWRDDSQVVGYLPNIGKWYSLKPRIEIKIVRLNVEIKEMEG